MAGEPVRRLDDGVLRWYGRDLIPRVLAGLVRRGEDFDAAEDALQEALLEALRVWPAHPPHDPGAWLTAVTMRRLVDVRRSEAARQRREETSSAERPPPAGTEEGDDTLFLLFCCCHPDLAPASQVALTLRAVGGLTTREIADAFYVPETTMAQRISRAKRTLRGRRLNRPGDLAVVLRVLYLVYTAGHIGSRIPARPPRPPDLAGEAIRLARQLTLATEEPEARGLLVLMLLNPARLPARLDSQGRIVTLDRQDRGLWDTRQIAEGVRVLQSALASRRPGRYQVEAAIAALHDDAASAEETDWPQILAWYDDLVALTDDPVRQDPAAVLGRAVAVRHVLGAAAGLRETDRLREVFGERHRWHAVRGYLHELSGDLPAAAAAYSDGAHRATDVAERDHLVHQAARRARRRASLRLSDDDQAHEARGHRGRRPRGRDPSSPSSSDSNCQATRPPTRGESATSRSPSSASTPSSLACEPAAPSSLARWSATRTAIGSDTSAAGRGLSSSRRRWRLTPRPVGAPQRAGGLVHGRCCAGAAARRWSARRWATLLRARDIAEPLAARTATRDRSRMATRRCIERSGVRRRPCFLRMITREMPMRGGPARDSVGLRPGELEED